MLYLPSALSKMTTCLFMNDCCLFLSRTLPVPLSQTYFGWWRRFRPNVAAVSGRRFRSILGHLEFMDLLFYSNHRERNLLSSANKFPSCWCCGISVHVPTSFCCCGLQTVYTARTSSTDLGKSRDFVRTSGFTFGDNITRFVTAFSVVPCCVLLSTCSSLSHPFCFHGSGRVF